MVGPSYTSMSDAGGSARKATGSTAKGARKTGFCSWQASVICQCFFAGIWCVLVVQRLSERLNIDRMVSYGDQPSSVSFQSQYNPPPKIPSSFWHTENPPFQPTRGARRKPAIMPFGLSVNHLQKIDIAGGALPEQVAAPEDFLPVVLQDNLQLRFRLKSTAGATAFASREITAYQITAIDAYSKKVLWDSGMVSVVSMPDHVPWGGHTIPVGSIVEWKVSVWDYDNRGPSESPPSKFAVGPSHDNFQSKWIVHPKDKGLFEPNEIKQFWHGNKEPGVKRWKERRPLPLARAKVDLSSTEASDIVSAMLVVSGLGAFSASVDGKPLSSSSAMDPPLTEFSLRISYRGYDVTQFFAGKKNAGSHVIGITLGSGWFDARPLDGGIIKHHLLPRGPLTTIAELHVTTKDGTTKVLAPTGANGQWQMAKGFLLDSDIFTGDVTDLGRLKALQGWDSPTAWSAVDSAVESTDIVWQAATEYSSNIDTKKWREIITGRAVDTAPNVEASFDMAPLGRLVPIEAPPVMPVERMPVESISSLGDGRWLLDFGKAISGVVRFDKGLPKPIKPQGGYPRGHTYPTSDEYISVIYGENIQMETGDINLVLVAGMGLHDGGARKTRGDPNERAGPGYPKDHGTILAQRDVFVAPQGKPELFGTARKSSFTTHGFRFAEVCCSEKPPTDAYAVLYRTAFEEWGTFDSSHVNLNGAHELIRNAFNSNLLGVQSDCPHREKLQYGGDLMSDSPAAMHLYDMGAFYNKVIHDWTDVQWKNGAYTETTPWHDLNDYAGIGHGAGETVWASLPVVLTARHMQHYGEVKLLKDSLDQHVKWMNFLRDFWDTKNWEQFGGLGDWLSVHNRDTFLTHHAYFMATARSIAYIANHLQGLREDSQLIVDDALNLAGILRNWLNKVYIQQRGNEGVVFTKNNHGSTPSADLGLFAKIVPGEHRCSVLRHFVGSVGSGRDKMWHGGEEMRQYGTLSASGKAKAQQLGMLMKSEGGKNVPIYRLGYNTFEGILAIRYTLKTLSDNGFHDIAVNKVAGIGFPSVEYMLSHNATTMWETWWRSEDVFSRNHPMLGAIAEWLPTSVAGVALAPRTSGGRELLFWPRVPTTNKLVYASATQGTKRGDAAIAWRFVDNVQKEGLSFPTSTTVQVRVLVPPSSSATFRLPFDGIQDGSSVAVQYASTLPDFEKASDNAKRSCADRRSKRLGFAYNWEFDRNANTWDIEMRGKAIGTPCESFLFDRSINSGTKWSTSDQLVVQNTTGAEIPLAGGFYEIRITKWKVNQYTELHGDYEVTDVGPYCDDTQTYEWDISDALNLI